MKFKRSYKLKVEEIAQKYGFSTGTPSGLAYTIVHNSRTFSGYMFGNWEDEMIIRFDFHGTSNDPSVKIVKVSLYREGIEKSIKPFVDEVIEELHSGKETPQALIVATEIGHDTRWFGRRKIRSTIKR